MEFVNKHLGSCEGNGVVVGSWRGRTAHTLLFVAFVVVPWHSSRRSLDRHKAKNAAWDCSYGWCVAWDPCLWIGSLKKVWGSKCLV